MEFFWLFVKFIAFTYISEMLAPKPPAQQVSSNGLKDLSFPTVDPTRPHQWLFGTRLLDNANVFATTDFRIEERSKKVRTGLFTSQDAPLPPLYYVGISHILCAGTGVHIRKIFVGERLAWTGDITSGQSAAIDVQFNESGQEDYPRGIVGTFDLQNNDYLTPAYTYLSNKNAYLAGVRGGRDNVPFWPGIAIGVLRGTTSGGAWVGTSRQVEQLKLLVQRFPHPFGPAEYKSIGEDANPAYAIADVLQDRQHGAGIGELLDQTSFIVSAQKLHDEGHGVSQLWDSQRTAGDVIFDICKQIGALLVSNPTTGLIELRLLRESDAPVITLNDSNVKVLSELTRASPEGATNTLTVSYTSAAEGYKPRTVEVQDQGAIDAAGGQVIPSTAAYAGISNAQLASVIALRDLRAISSPLATVRLTALIPQSVRIMPGDPVLLQSPANDITSMRMRVISSNYSKAGEAACELELLEDVFRQGVRQYGVPAPVAPVDSMVVPSLINAEFTGVIPAPYGLYNSATDRGLFYATAPDTTTTGYGLAWYETDPTALEYDGRSSIGFAVRGTLNGGLLETASVDSLTLNINAANAATLKRTANKRLHGFIDGTNKECIYSTGWYLGAGETTVVLTGVTRATFDTIALAHTAGEAVVLLCDYAVDKSNLLTTVKDAGGTAVRSLTGETTVHCKAKGRNAYGFTSLGTAREISKTGWLTNDSRAPLPYPPGKVTVRDMVGASTDGTAKNVGFTPGVAMAVEWSTRNRMSDGIVGWCDVGEFFPEPGTKTAVVVVRTRDGATSQIVNVTVDGKIQSIPAASLAVGDKLQVSVYSVAADGAASKSQTWYWALT